MKRKWENILLYIVYSLLIIFLLTQKVNFHVDELLTYNLANAEEWFAPEDGITFVPAEKPFISAMTSDGRIDLKNVWRQQENDTHPPFYYMLVHAICTLFPNKFSIAYAGSINIVFQLLSLYIYRKIIRLLIDNKKIVYILSVMYILCAGVLSISVFLRMYVMAIFWILLFTYIILQNIQKYNVKEMVKLAIVALCGALTHYYFLIYAFFISAVLVLIMIYEKRKKEVFLYFLSMGVAGIITYLIFPAIIPHIFLTGRGSQSMERLGNSNLFKQLIIYYELLSKNLFGGMLTIIVIIFALVYVCKIIKGFQNEKSICLIDKVEKYRYLCLLIPLIGYILLVSKTAPYNTSRYLSPIYGVAMIGIMCLLYKCISYMLKEEKWRIVSISSVVLVIVTFNFLNCKWENLKLNSKEKIENAECYGENADAICLYSVPWKINPSFLEMSQCKSSTFFNVSNYNEFVNKCNISEFDDGIAFFLIDIEVEPFIEAFIADNPEYEVVKKNGKYGYARSIYLKKQVQE